MEYEWDENKALKVLEKHGLDLRRAPEVFDDEHVETPGLFKGEERSKAIGMLDGVLVAVVFTMRAGKRRLITMRRARNDERRAYLSRNDRRDPQA